MTHPSDLAGDKYDFMRLMSELLSKGIQNADFKKITGTIELQKDSEIKGVLVEIMQLLDTVKAKLAEEADVNVLKAEIAAKRGKFKVAVQSLAQKYNSVDMGDPYFFTNWIKAVVTGLQMLEIASDAATMQDDLDFIMDEYLGGKA